MDEDNLSLFEGVDVSAKVVEIIRPRNRFGRPGQGLYRGIY